MGGASKLPNKRKPPIRKLKARGLHLHVEENHRRHDEAEAYPVDRKVAKGDEGQRERDKADDAGPKEAGADELNDDSEPAHSEQKKGDVRVGDDLQEALQCRLLDVSQGEAGGFKDNFAAA